MNWVAVLYWEICLLSTFNIIIMKAFQRSYNLFAFLLYWNEWHFFSYFLAGNSPGRSMYRQGRACSACPPGSRCSTTTPGLCVAGNSRGGQAATAAAESPRNPETFLLAGAGLSLGIGGKALLVNQFLEMQQRRQNADRNNATGSAVTPSPGVDPNNGDQ